MHLLVMFPYFILSLFLFLILTVGWKSIPVRFKRSVCISAILSAPISLASYAFVPAYWDPIRIVPYQIGPEDVIFSFSTGGIIWVFVILILSRKYNVIHNEMIVFKQYAGLLFFGIIMFFLMWLARINVMLATLIIIFMIGIWILIRKPDYMILSITGALAFTLFYFCILKGAFVLFPEFAGQWNTNGLIGIKVHGIPAEELMWAFATGAVWPLIVAYLLNVQLERKILPQSKL